MEINNERRRKEDEKEQEEEEKEMGDQERTDKKKRRYEGGMGFHKLTNHPLDNYHSAPLFKTHIIPSLNPLWTFLSFFLSFPIFFSPINTHKIVYIKYPFMKFPFYP